ncbi:MAG: maleylpyruvate isomerase N-terminal domain-containing protein [Tepidiformaceae bacterium]
MDEEREALLRHYREMRSALLAAIEGLSDAELTEPSVDGWAVKDHLAHLATWDALRGAEVERISSEHASAWQASEEQVGAFNALSYELQRGLSLAQVRWELTTTHERLLAAIAEASERGLEAAHYSEAALRSTHEAQHTGWLVSWRSRRGV